MNDARTILQLPCAADFRGRSALRKSLLHALRGSSDPVILDLTGHYTLDHEDVDLVLECVAQAAGRDTELVLVAGSPAVRILLDVVRLSSVARVFSSLQEALVGPQMLLRKVAQDIRSIPFELPRSA